MDATGLAIDPDVGSVEPKGPVVVSPSASTTYTITTEGPAGSSSATGSISVSHPPSIALVEPDGVADDAPGRFLIRWEDVDSEENATISLYHDDNNYGADGVLIAGGLSEDPDGEGNDEYIYGIRPMRRKKNIMSTR